MLAIHHERESYSEKWIQLCKEKKISYKIVNCYSTDIIQQLDNCDRLMWHWNQNDYKAQLFAKQFIFSIEKKGIKVFPNFNTCMMFDDKVGQKYLLEAIGAPLVKSYVFYDLASTLRWIETTTFPKVFKLRSGAGASNVFLLHNRFEAKKYAKQMFAKGMGFDRLHPLNERIWHFKRDQTLKSFFDISRGIGRVFVPNEVKKSQIIQKNYFYAQDFIPNNDSDIRIITIGDRAFAIKRMIRENDFRASGSGLIIYDPREIPKKCLEIAFDISERLQLQSAAFDFVFLEGAPLIIEMSYAFNQAVYRQCPGYWDKKLNWINRKFIPEYFILEDLIDV